MDGFPSLEKRVGMSDSGFAVRLEGVTKRFGKHVGVEDITFELPADEEGCVGVLLGPNGAGKSTLLRIVLGLLQPDAGEVHVLGMDPVRDADRVLVHSCCAPCAGRGCSASTW